MQTNHPGERKKRSFLWIIVVVCVLLAGAAGLYFQYMGSHPAQVPTPVIARGKIPPPPPSPSVESPTGPSMMMESEPAARTEIDANAPAAPSQGDLESSPAASLDAVPQESVPETATEPAPPQEDAAIADNGQTAAEDAERNVSPGSSAGQSPDSGMDDGSPADAAGDALQSATKEMPDGPQPSDATPLEPSGQPAAEAEASAPTALSTGVPKAATFYSIQVGAYRGKDNADRQVALLREKGYEAYLYEKNEEDQRAWYFVRFGRFEDFGSANKTLRVFKEREQMDGTVVNSD